MNMAILGKIVDTAEARHWLLNAANKDTLVICFCSAYIKIDSLKYFHQAYLTNGFRGTGKILARWQPNDIMSGASDLEVYEYCKNVGFDFYIKNDFHGKIYKISPGEVLIGSHNLTGSGFGINKNSNDETGVLIADSAAEDYYFNELFSNGTKVDDQLFSLISNFVKNAKRTEISTSEWSKEIKEVLISNRRSMKLLVEDFYYSTGIHLESVNEKDVSFELAHDFSLLAIPYEQSMNLQMIRSKFELSRAYLWLIESLKLHDGEMYFGKLTEILHNDLFDDPKPYRRDVKNLLSNLLIWIEKLEISGVRVDQPRHSQRVRLINI